jgi:cytosine/adenosine deaminase-related metal-dependent hydrolase
VAPGQPLAPRDAPVACWRFVPSQKGSWQHGVLDHDADLDGWLWEDCESDEAPRDAKRAYWTPPLLDAHTHLGDAFLRSARDNLPRSIEALVAPPHGIKHKELARADPKKVQQAIQQRSEQMTGLGTKAALDFREGGEAGLKLLLQATTGTGLDVHALVRPASPTTEQDTWKEEAVRLLAAPTLGLGLSGIRDLPPNLLDHAAEACNRNEKPLALHLSEARYERVEDALRYDAGILVHLVHTRSDEWDPLVDSKVLAVTCPTSNRFFGERPPLDAFYEAHRQHGLDTAVGTDNAMLSDGDLRDEARLIMELVPQADLDWLLRSMSWNPWRHLRLGPDPRHPGLLWGLDTKTPHTHPENTPLSKTASLWENHRQAPAL